MVTVTTTAARWSMPRSAVPVEELPETQLVVRKRLRARQDRALLARVVLVTGIPAAAVVRVGRVSVIQLMVDLACWFRFWVVTCTGVVAEEDPDIPSAAVMEELVEVVVERSIPLPVEPG